jgi:hypothetical protein
VAKALLPVYQALRSATGSTADERSFAEVDDEGGLPAARGSSQRQPCSCNVHAAVLTLPLLQTATARQAARPLPSTTCPPTPSLTAGLLSSGRTRYGGSSNCSMLSYPSPPLQPAACQLNQATSSSSSSS